MKQGSASRSGPGGRKIEPRGPNYTPGAASQIGEALGNHATSVGHNIHGSSAPMYEGRHDNLAPKAGVTVHHGGSQRKHD